MTKFFEIFFLMLVSLTIFNHSSAFGAILKCKFRTSSWTLIGNIYECDVGDNESFNGSRVTIDSIEGEHASGYSNSDVKGLQIESISNVNFFPANIKQHFMNLILIRIANSQLQEITLKDLQPFSNLQILSLGSNKIKVIEKDTFKYNPGLRLIWLYNNEISHIDNEAFSGLKSLEQLWLAGNKCKKPNIDASTREATLKVIKNVEAGDCSIANLADVNWISKNNDSTIQSEIIDNLTQNIDNKLQVLSENVNNNSASIDKLHQNQKEISKKFNVNAKINAEFKIQISQKFNELRVKNEKMTAKFDELRNQSEIINSLVNNLTQNIDNKLQAQNNNISKMISESETNITGLRNNIDQNYALIQSDLKVHADNLREKSLEQFNESLIINYENLTAKLGTQAEKMNFEFSTLIKSLNVSLSELLQNDKARAEEINQITLGVIIACSIFILLIIILSIMLTKLWLKYKMTNSNETQEMKFDPANNTNEEPIFLTSFNNMESIELINCE